jgi:hypothetical protein
MQFTLHIVCSNFGRLNNSLQHNGVEARTEAFAVACYRGHIDDVRRLSESDNVRDNVDMLGVGLHFALLQELRRKREHWDIIRWLMDNTILRDNPLVLRWAFVVACDDNELEEVRWMLQYRQLAQDTDTIDHALEYALSRHLALVKCVVEHSDVDFNRLRRVGTLLHDVIWRSERRSDLHLVCDDSSSDAEDVYRLVYERGANVNEQDNYGNTPLHVACYHGNQDIVEALMSCGADVNITNDDKRTPAQQAIYSGHRNYYLCWTGQVLWTHTETAAKVNMRHSISVHLTALFVHSIIDFRILASIRLLFV